MIDKVHRFQGRGSLRFVYQRGQSVRGQACSLRYILNRRRSVYRVAVVVSKKVHKSAVVRNRIRRRIYEIIRTTLDTRCASYDLVIITYNDQLADMPFEQLNQVITELLYKAGAIDDAAQSPEAGRVIVVPKEK